MLKILFNFEILQQGTQIAFDLHSSFQKLREKLSPLLKSVLNALEAFQTPLRSPSHFLKTAKEFKEIRRPIGKHSN